MRLHLLPVYLAISDLPAFGLESFATRPVCLARLERDDGLPSQLRRSQVSRRKSAFKERAESRSIATLHAGGIAMCRTVQALGIDSGYIFYVFRVVV